MSSFQNQGPNTSRAFAGQGTSEATRQTYTESAPLFARLLREHFSQDETPRILADFGSHKGEFLSELLNQLPDLAFTPVAIDANKHALRTNRTERQVVANVEHLPVADKSFEVSICRYVLQWNLPDTQRRILKEIARTTKRMAIIQHAGSQQGDIRHRSCLHALMSGSVVASMQRRGYHFSSSDEIERWMQRTKTRFTRVEHRIIRNVSDVYIERYALNKEDAEKVKHVLNDHDYFVQTTWILFP